MADTSSGGAPVTEVPKSPVTWVTAWPPAWLPPVAVLVALVIWPIIGYFASRAWQGAQNRIEDWLPASFPETQLLFDFVDRFGSDEFLMISWEDCQLGDPRADKLSSLLTGPANNGQIYFAKADSGRKVVDELASRIRVSELEARRKLQGLLLGPDGRQSCVIALISKQGMADRKAAMRWVWQAAEMATELPPEQIRVAGITADSIAIDEASNAYLVELNLLSMLICFLILWIPLRNLWLAGTVFLVALLHQHLALAFIYLSGGHIDSVQLLVANLCFVLTISAGLHYLGYFRRAYATNSASAAYVALRQAFVPTMLAAATTSIGFISLCTSQLVPIRSFGFYSAVLVPVNAIVVLGILSIHSSWAIRRNWRFQPMAALPTVCCAGPSKLQDNPASQSDIQPNWFMATLTRLGSRPLMYLGLWSVAIIACGAGSYYLKSSVGTHSMLSEDSKLVRDYAWLEARIGPLIPIEVVLHYSNQQPIDTAETFRRVTALDELRRQIEALEEIQGSMSALTFLPKLPTTSGIRSTVRRAAVGRIAEESKTEFRDLRLLHEDDREQSWRLSGRVAGSSNMNYETILNKLQEAIDIFRSDPKRADIDVTLSGGIPFIYRTQSQLLSDLLLSFSVAFGMIAIAMSLVFRSLLAGLVLMIPNVTPAAIVFGTMGWIGMEIELGTVLTASVMMGVCVDNTLHLVTHYRSMLREGLDNRAAVLQAVSSCRGAMVHTSLVCGLGMLAFALSSFTPVARFAWLTFAMLSVGAISDLLVTPLILLSPLSRFFGPEPGCQLDKPNQLMANTGASGR